MEKICIVKRRREAGVCATSPERGRQALSPAITVELTHEQAELIRGNGHFRQLCPDEAAPIVLSLHFNAGFPERMRKGGEVCRLLQVSRQTLGRLVRQGRIRSYRIGRLRRFSAEDVMDYLASVSDTARPSGVRLTNPIVGKI